MGNGRAIGNCPMDIGNWQSPIYGSAIGNPLMGNWVIGNLSMGNG